MLIRQSYEPTETVSSQMDGFHSNGKCESRGDRWLKFVHVASILPAQPVKHQPHPSVGLNKANQKPVLAITMFCIPIGL